MRLKQETLARALAVTGLVLVCINPGLTQGHDCLNLLLCGALCLSPLVLLMRGARVFLPRIDIPAMLMAASVMAMPAIFHPDTLRPATMLFTCAWCVFFMMYVRVLRLAALDASLLMRLIRGVVYAFCAVLLVQQLCVLAGWPVFCPGMEYPGQPFKLNSLTSEPSHSSFTLATLALFYSIIWRTQRPQGSLWLMIREAWPMWLAWGWVLFSTMNASAYVLAPLCLLPFLSRRSIGWFGAGVLLLVCAVFFTPLRRQAYISRIVAATEAVATLDNDAIFDADPSASNRIIPNIIGARELMASGAGIVTGNGVDADMRIDQPWFHIFRQSALAGIFTMWFNYGILATIGYWWLIGASTLSRRRRVSWLVFALAFIMSSNFNMQLCWLVMLFGVTVKFAVWKDDSVMSRLRIGRLHGIEITETA